MKRWTLLMYLALATLPAHADLYKWVDADGKIHYSDTPPPAAVKKSERKRLTDKPAEQTMPYSLQQAVRNFPVTLFSYDCGEGCTQASALLKKRGVPHTLKDPMDPKLREDLKKATGGEEVAPVLQVGRKVLRGFEEGQWNAALDNAGYPSTALIPVKPVIAKPAPDPVPPPEPVAEPEAAAPETESTDSGQN